MYWVSTKYVALDFFLSKWWIRNGLERPSPKAYKPGPRPRDSHKRTSFVDPKKKKANIIRLFFACCLRTWNILYWILTLYWAIKQRCQNITANHLGHIESMGFDQNFFESMGQNGLYSPRTNFLHPIKLHFKKKYTKLINGFEWGWQLINLGSVRISVLYPLYYDLWCIEKRRMREQIRSNVLC